MTLLTPTPAPDAAAALAHECDAPAHDASATTRESRTRLVGLDAARGLALIGMFAVHTMSSVTPDGDLSTAWALSSGKASALFAVLGGVGIAFMTGRTRPPRGADWARAAVTPLVRGVLILALGLALGAVVSVDFADVILPYLGVMFVISVLVLPLGPRALVGLGLGWAVIGPVLGHLLRQHAPAPVLVNFTFADVVAQPGQWLTTVLLTGFFPAMTWMAYLIIGMGIGRSRLSTRRVVAWLVGGGAALTVASSVVTAALVAWGLRDRLAADVAGHMSLDTFTEYLVWGGDGTLPTDSVWWLGVNAPHTGTPLDLLYTSGIAMLVIGLFLALSLAMGPLLAVLAAPGSMTLTLYSAHLLLLRPLSRFPDAVTFLVQVGVLVVFALAWSSRFSRGPLEFVVARITQAIAPRRRVRA